MRQQLQAKAKEREEFESKNKQLIAEMEVEKVKLGKSITYLVGLNIITFTPFRCYSTRST